MAKRKRTFLPVIRKSGKRRRVKKDLTISRLTSFDTETTGLEMYRGDKIFAYCIGEENGDVEVVRFDRGAEKKRRKQLQDYLDDVSIAKIGHNVKFEIAMLIMNGFTIPKETVWHDTQIMSRMLRNLSRDHSLDVICWELCGWKRDLDLKVQREARAYRGYQNVDVETMNAYQIADGQRTMLLYKTFWEEIESDPKLLADYLNEIELVKVTQQVEQYGIQLDVKGTQKIVDECEKRVLTIEEEIEEMCGEPYNLASGPQVAELLYDVFKLPVLAYTKSGKRAVDKDVLGDLRAKNPHKVLDLLQEHRSLKKGGATAAGYLDLVDSKGLIHPNIKTNHAQTGREACDNPNLQNVSKTINAKNPFIVPLRRCFGPRKRHMLFSLDQSGIELRLIIEAAQCELMMNMMRSGTHPHIEAAKMFYGDKWTSKKEHPELYSGAKNGHFCLCYGGSLPKFAQALNLELAAARPGYEAYQRKFPEIAYLSRNGASEVDALGYVTTAFGRRLYIPHGKSYIWLNYYIQGTAAGIIKRGQVRVADWLLLHYPEIRQVLTVHDDIMFECPIRLWEDRSTKILKGISRIMTTMEEINVPLEVEATYTYHSWDRMEDIAI